MVCVVRLFKYIFLKKCPGITSVARLYTDTDGNCAEFAILIGDSW